MPTTKPVTADIVAVGSELLTPFRTDSNSLWITQRLIELGIEVRAKHVAPDEPTGLSSVLRHALDSSRVVIVTGGLGPTLDDLTRETTAALLSRKLLLSDELLAGLEARFRSFGYRMPATNRRQAMVPEGAVALPNRAGSAPGLFIPHDDGVIILMPGPPREMKVVWEEAMPHLREQIGSRRRTFHTEVLRVVGLPESRLDELASPVYQRFRSVRTSVLFSAYEIEMHLAASGRSPGEARGRAERLADALETVLAPHVYARGDTNLETVLVGELARRTQTLAIAESCTGGGIARRITSVPGASAVLELAAVTYANRAKTKLLGVKKETLRRHGAVSENTAREMARGIRREAKSDYGLAVTGIAGPTGGTPDKPVGTVFVALAAGRESWARRFRIPGDRALIRSRSEQAALEMLRRKVLGIGRRA